MSLIVFSFFFIFIPFLTYYCLASFLVRIKLIKLPLELKEYKKTLKETYRVYFGLWIALPIVLLLMSTCIRIIGVNYFWAYFCIVIISFLFSGIAFIKSLTCLCPKCGKSLIDDKWTFGVDLKLLNTHCPKCNFKFEKSKDVYSKSNANPELRNVFKKFFPYLPLIIFSFVISICGISIYSYFTTKQATINRADPALWISTTIVFCLLNFLLKKRKENSKCQVCGSQGEDHIEINRKDKKVCRAHLIEQLRKVYLNFESKMVVIYPDLEDKTKSYYAYQYYTNEELKKFKLDDIVGELTRKGLESISGKCQKCSNLANVALYGKGSFQWEDDYPVLQNMNQDPELLCLECSFKLIEPSLRNYKGLFEERVIVPHKGEGILMPWTY